MCIIYWDNGDYDFSVVYILCVHVHVSSRFTLCTVLYIPRFLEMFGFFTGGRIYFSRMRAKIEVLKLLTGEAEAAVEGRRVCCVVLCVDS